MGGAFACAGNITPYAEANIYHDAQAADDVFASGINTVMVGLDATLQTLLAPADFTEMARTSPVAGGFINRISQFYLGFYRSVGITNGCPMHDATAVLACVYPERFTLQMTGLRSVTGGERTGATIADTTRPPVAVATAVDANWAVTSIVTVRMVSIYALGNVSGGSFSPAIPIALGPSEKITWKEVAIYCAVQLIVDIYAGPSFAAMLWEVVNVAPKPGFGWGAASSAS